MKSDFVKSDINSMPSALFKVDKFKVSGVKTHKQFNIIQTNLAYLCHLFTRKTHWEDDINFTKNFIRMLKAIERFPLLMDHANE